MAVLWLPSVITGIACVPALFVLVRYKALVRSRNRVHEAWSAFESQLRQRASLIPRVVDIDQAIAFARERYNRNVLDYNRRIEIYPEAFFAHAFNFMPYDLFEVGEQAQGEPRASYPPAA
jgi:hypothetical protein